MADTDEKPKPSPWDDLILYAAKCAILIVVAVLGSLAMRITGGVPIELPPLPQQPAPAVMVVTTTGQPSIYSNAANLPQKGSVP